MKLTPNEYRAMLRSDFNAFIERSSVDSESAINRFNRAIDILVRVSIADDQGWH